MSLAPALAAGGGRSPPVLLARRRAGHEFGGFKNLFGDEGGSLTRATGQGTVLVSGYGALEPQELAP